MEENSICSKCQTSILENSKFCPSCGFPQNGTLEEKKQYNFRIGLKKNVVKSASKKLKNVKTLLYILASLNFLVGLYFISNDNMVNQGIGNLLISVVFLGCVAWVNNQPLIGIMAAFAFWILLQILTVIIDPTQLFSGIILKVIIFGVFIKGVSSAKDYNQFSAELKEMNEV
jgi:zinc ribbon protein